MNLVVHQVRKFEHVDVADGYVLCEFVAGHAVEKRDLAALRQFGELEQMADVPFAGAVENRRSERNAFAETLRQVENGVVVEIHDRLPDRGGPKSILEVFAHYLDARVGIEQLADALAELLGSPAEMRFEDLADVHARRNAQR